MSDTVPPEGFRTFVILWITQSVSVIGSALTFFATTIWITKVLYPRPEQKPELAWALSAVSLAFALPMVFGAPIAGAWADRHDRKRTMVAMDTAAALLSVLFVTLLLTNHLSLPWLLALLTLFSACGAFHFAAFDSSYAMIVPPEQLPRANGMMQTTWSGSNVVAPALAAGLIALPALARQGHFGGPAGPLARLTDGTPLVVAIDGITFLLAAVTPLFLFVPSPMRHDLHTGDGGRKAVWEDIREGALYITRRKPLLWLLATFTVANFVLAPINVFQPLLVRFNLAADWHARGYTFETALAFLGTLFGLGGVAGGFLISAWGGLRSRRIFGVVVPMLLLGLTMVVYGLSPFLYLSAAMAFLAGFVLPSSNAHSQAIWQNQTPRELQGRVFSVRRLIAQCTMPVSTAIAGWAGAKFDAGHVIALMGALMALFCVLQLFNPMLLNVDDKEWLDRLAGREAESEPV